MAIKHCSGNEMIFVCIHKYTHYLYALESASLRAANTHVMRSMQHANMNSVVCEICARVFGGVTQPLIHTITNQSLLLLLLIFRNIYN